MPFGGNYKPGSSKKFDVLLFLGCPVATAADLLLIARRAKFPRTGEGEVDRGPPAGHLKVLKMCLSQI